jgi:MFS family permease
VTFDTATRRNVVLLTIAQALGAAGPPIIGALGGLVGQVLAPSQALATVPISLFTLGLALGILPATAMMRRAGRRGGYLLGAWIGVAGGLIAGFGVLQGSFLFFCLGVFAVGLSGSYVQSYRFAATDGVPPDYRAKAISWVMVGGLFAAIIGPQMVIWTRDALPVAFAGSFFGLAALALLAVPILALLRKIPQSVGPAGPSGGNAGGRPLTVIMSSRRFVLAAGSGLVSFGLMSFVMTAAPIAMVGCGLTVPDAALGIQWHVLSMFGPSFFTGHLITRFGKEKVTAFGLLIMACSSVVALSGMALWHFWAALILLGLGWNFGFIGATAMVTDCHTPEERAKTQGANDFLIFGAVAVASFLSGTLLTATGWATINLIMFPIVALVLLPLLWRIARNSPQTA